MAALSLPRDCRLRRAADFRRVYERRRSAGDARLLVFACENTLGYARLGLSVSRKVGGAVVRNRWKRLVREVFRQCRDRLPGGVDYIVVPRADADPRFDDVLDSLPRLARRAAAKLEPGTA